MDPSLRREKEAFKKRALAAAEKSQKIREAAAKNKIPVEKVSKPPKSKRKVQSSQVSSSKDITLKEIKDAAYQAYRNENEHRVLKCIMDMLKMKYINKDVEDKLTFEEILSVIGLSDIRYDMRQWLHDALTSNSKVLFSSEEDSFIFKPALGHHVRNKKQLLTRLQDYDREGLGGITMTDICEAIPKPEKTVKRLLEESRIVSICRQDKEQVIFYNNLEFCLEEKVPPELQELWHQVSVDGMTDTDIDKYLGDQGLGAMQGETRKRKLPSSTQKKARKKAKPTKVLNTHLDNQLLKDYSADTSHSHQD